MTRMLRPYLLPILLLVALGPLALRVQAQAPAEKPLPEDRWYVVEFLGERAGYMHTSTRAIRYRGRPAVATQVEVRNELSRLNAGTTETVVITSKTRWVEDMEGRTLSVETVMDQGGGKSEASLEVVGGTGRVTFEGPAGKRRFEVPWNDEVYGPRVSEKAIDELLAGRKKVARFKSFSFEAGNRILDVTARVVERTPDGGAVVVQELGGVGVEVRETYDAEGDLVQQVVGPVTMRLADRRQALAPLGDSLRAFDRSNALLDRPLETPRRLVDAGYRLRPREGDGLVLAELFVTDHRQRIETVDERDVLWVRAVEGEPVVGFDPAPYLAPSGLIESDDPAIRRRAAAVVGDDDLPPAAAARKLERWVHDHVRFQGSGIGLATARQTLESKDGDCTENAFLLTALLRAREIPARVVVGLVYVGEPGGKPTFVPHAWVEAYADGWLTLDSAIYGPPVDAARLAMAKSEGSEEGAMVEVTVPLLKGLGRFDLAWVEPRR